MSNLEKDSFGMVPRYKPKRSGQFRDHSVQRSQRELTLAIISISRQWAEPKVISLLDSDDEEPVKNRPDVITVNSSSSDDDEPLPAKWEARVQAPKVAEKDEDDGMDQPTQDQAVAGASASAVVAARLLDRICINVLSDGSVCNNLLERGDDTICVNCAQLELATQEYDPVTEKAQTPESPPTPDPLPDQAPTMAELERIVAEEKKKKSKAALCVADEIKRVTAEKKKEKLAAVQEPADDIQSPPASRAAAQLVKLSESGSSSSLSQSLIQTLSVPPSIDPVIPTGPVKAAEQPLSFNLTLSLPLDEPPVPHRAEPVEDAAAQKNKDLEEITLPPESPLPELPIKEAEVPNDDDDDEVPLAQLRPVAAATHTKKKRRRGRAGVVKTKPVRRNKKQRSD